MSKDQPLKETAMSAQRSSPRGSNWERSSLNHEMEGVVNNLHLVCLPRSTAADNETCLEVFEREIAYVYRTLRRLGTARSDVEDLAQEVFLALCSSWSLYDQTRPLKPYLFGIAFRVASAHHRKNRREAALRVLEMPDDSRPDPHDLLAAKRARALLLAALERVPLLRRAVLVMHEIDGIPVDEVAAALSIPRFTVYSRLRKARRELKDAVRIETREPRGLA